MARLLGTVTFRLALGYGLLLAVSMAVISAVFYFGTVGVLAHRTDGKIAALTGQLEAEFKTGGTDAVRQHIDRLLADGIDSDTEIYLLVDPKGRKLAGNVTAWLSSSTVPALREDPVMRLGHESFARLLTTNLPDGSKIVIGFDLQDQRDIERIVLRALGVGGIVALFFAIGGAILFRRQLDRRAAAIRRTAREIEAGDMTRRVPQLGAKDEFARLGDDVNHMLDRIEQLMDGVRHVSNAIAHDLRTPLARVRGRLDEALRPGADAEALAASARGAIRVIDELIGVFDRLLQIAEAESGARRRSFEPVALDAVIASITELYDAEAESRGIDLRVEMRGAPATFGDRHLLASAVANLVDNAIKYAGRGATVRVQAIEEPDAVSIVVEDNGPGVAAEERPRLTERFYRVDRARSQPGNGLGLAIVSALAALHEGTLTLEDAVPGLRVRLRLPRLVAPERVTVERQRRFG
jgi:signal transduction histidine kinase